jgi:hypothetical protein
MTSINTLISKWILEDHLTDPELGNKIRTYYWRELHPREHWVWEDDGEEMSGYGYDEAFQNDDGEDEIY